LRGNVQVAQGQLSEALDSYQVDLAISDRLAKSDPGNAGRQRDLSVSYDNVGNVQVAQGDARSAFFLASRARAAGAESRACFRFGVVFVFVFAAASRPRRRRSATPTSRSTSKHN